MGTLTAEEKVKIRKAMAKIATENSMPVSWVKAAVEAAAQAVEDILDGSSFKTQVSDDIDAAVVVPYGITFTNQQKKWIGAVVMESTMFGIWCEVTNGNA